jgi:hypothetical protein
MLSAVKLLTELTVPHATVQKGKVEQKAAPSRTIHFSRWSAIKGYGQ